MAGARQPLREHPWMLLLIVLGLGWMLRAPGARERHGNGDLGREIASGPKAWQVREGRAARAERATGNAAGGYSSPRAAEQPIGDVPRGTARSSIARAYADLSRRQQEHPLAFGALAVLAGATIALLLPRSAMEEQLVGPAGEALRRQAGELGLDAARRLGDIAERAAEAAATAVKQAAREGDNPPTGDTPAPP
jgi:hypothetical protein